MLMRSKSELAALQKLPGLVTCPLLCLRLSLVKLTVCLSSLQHQQQVMGAIERAKQVTPPEMNSIIRVSFTV